MFPHLEPSAQVHASASNLTAAYAAPAAAGVPEAAKATDLPPVIFFEEENTDAVNSGQMASSTAGGLSAYEIKRNENVLSNKRALQDMGIEPMIAMKPPAARKVRASKLTPANPNPSRGKRNRNTSTPPPPAVVPPPAVAEVAAAEAAAAAEATAQAEKARKAHAKAEAEAAARAKRNLEDQIAMAVCADCTPITGDKVPEDECVDQGKRGIFCEDSVKCLARCEKACAGGRGASRAKAPRVQL
jgi:hypothetical protein